MNIHQLNLITNIKIEREIKAFISLCMVNKPGRFLEGFFKRESLK